VFGIRKTSKQCHSLVCINSASDNNWLKGKISRRILDLSCENQNGQMAKVKEYTCCLLKHYKGTLMLKCNKCICALYPWQPSQEPSVCDRRNHNEIGAISGWFQILINKWTTIITFFTSVGIVSRIHVDRLHSRQGQETYLCSKP